MQRCDNCKMLTRHKVRFIGYQDGAELYNIMCDRCGETTKRWVTEGTRQD